MSLPDHTAASPDPFGLWELPSPAEAGEGQLSFGDLEGAAEQPTAIWRLPLYSEDPQAGEAVLVLRAGQVRAIETGLEDASRRMDAFLARQANRPGMGSVAFGLDEVDTPEANLALALAAIEQPAGAEGAVDFGLKETLGQAASALGLDWNPLLEKLNRLLDAVNRQLLHAAWVDTTLDGQLAARTTVNWGGDMNTLLSPALEPAIVQAHRLSLEQALASQTANVKTVLTVAQIAGKIALAVTTPLGVAQALSLAWQFVEAVVRDQ